MTNYSKENFTDDIIRYTDEVYDRLEAKHKHSHRGRIYDPKSDVEITFTISSARSECPEGKHGFGTYAVHHPSGGTTYHNLPDGAAPDHVKHMLGHVAHHLLR